jgi:hypothetical protein
MTPRNLTLLPTLSLQILRNVARREDPRDRRRSKPSTLESESLGRPLEAGKRGERRARDRPHLRALPHDLRILLASDEGSGYGSCSPAFGDALSSRSAYVRLHFVSAVVLSPDGKRQFTQTGVGTAKREAITQLTRKLAKRLSFLPDTKAPPAK